MLSKVDNCLPCRKRFRRRHMQALAFLSLVLFLLTSCSIGSSTTSSATPSVTKASTPVNNAMKGPTPVTALLEPAPTNYQQVSAPTIKTISGGWSGFHAGGEITRAGQEPVLLFDFSGTLNSSTTKILHVNSQGYTAWPETKILWEIKENNPATHVVTVQVVNQHTGQLAWWNTDRDPQQVLTLTTNLQTYHGSMAPGWQEWGSLLNISQAGCYKLDVSWSGGHWSMAFAAGR